MPCWTDKWRAEKEAARRKGGEAAKRLIELEAPEVFISVVVPAYNEEDRLEIMLREAVDHLDDQHQVRPKSNGTPVLRDWEILIVSDGSTDGTVRTALNYARTLPPASRPKIRVISLDHNRGKGGAVTHGMRHVRGQYAIFADADGATLFSDLDKLVMTCEDTYPYLKPFGIVAVGSRAHLVGSEAVVKRSKLRNFLMHSFHIFLRILTPPKTAAIKDTQCGFKIFSRSALGAIIPYMHCEGWIFDVEMLMLAESAGIKVYEIPVGWKEIGGSKLNVIWDSLGMAWGLAVLRAAWAVGVYRRY